MDFTELEDQQIPKISIGTSPFMGAGQFGQLGLIWRTEFLHNAEKMARLMMLSPGFTDTYLSTTHYYFCERIRISQKKSRMHVGDKRSVLIVL